MKEKSTGDFLLLYKAPDAGTVRSDVQLIRGDDQSVEDSSRKGVDGSSRLRIPALGRRTRRCREHALHWSTPSHGRRRCCPRTSTNLYTFRKKRVDRFITNVNSPRKESTQMRSSNWNLNFNQTPTTKYHSKKRTSMK